jgi:hypothetical protein
MEKIIIKKKEFEKLYKMACNSWKPKLDDKLKPFIFSDSIEFEDTFVSEMEQACTKEQKPVFEKIFSKFLNINEDLFKIKNYSELCKKTKIKELTILDFKFLPKEEQEKALAYHQIKNIERLYNGNWVKDFKNSNQYKYYPYFKDNGLALVFDVWFFPF